MTFDNGGYMIPAIQLGNVMIDCDDEEKLCSFYSSLLGWKRGVLFCRPSLTSENGIVFLFLQEEDYVPPVWPEETGKQQKQMHFDFQVSDVPLAVERAVSLGATIAKTQFGGGEESFVTMIDPAGHPFCLCASSNIG